MRIQALLVSFALASIGCTAPSSEVDDEATADDLNAAQQNVATLSFDSDWSETKTGTLVEGGRVRIRYATERLSQCRGSLSNGKPAWTITGFASVDRAPAKSFWVAGFSSVPTTTALPELALEKAGSIELWFQVTNVWGCSAWDSNLGHNYPFTIAAAPAGTAKLMFDADASAAPRLVGTATAGGKLEIDYAEARLPSCRMTMGSAPAWTITGFASSNGGAARSFYVAGHSADPTQVGTKPVLDLPRDGRVAIWFQVTNASGCSAWDSNLGRNYLVDVR